MGLYAGDVYVNFKPRDQWRTASPEALVVKMDAVLKQVPGIDYNFTAPMAMRLDEAISGVRTELGVKVFGDDLAVLERTAREIRDVIATVPGAADTSVDVSAGAMQVELALDRNALSRYGLNVADVRDAVQTAVGGTHATEIIDGRKRIPVVVRLGEAYRGTPEAIGQLLITAPPGGRVTLSQVAQVRVVGGPELITHENAQRMIIVQSNVRGRDLGGFAADVQRQVAARVPLPPGYFVSYGGQFENQQRAMSRLALIVPVVLLLIVGLLYASFGNGRHALLVMLNVPFALGRRHCGALAARAPSQPERIGRVHRALRDCRAQRRCSDRLHQPAAGSGHTAGRGGQRRLGDPFAAGVDDGARRELRVHPDGHRDDARLGSAAPAGDGGHRGTGELDRADAGGAASAVRVARRTVARMGGSNSPPGPTRVRNSASPGSEPVRGGIEHVGDGPARPRSG
jgi:hypothetical protein